MHTQVTVYQRNVIVKGSLQSENYHINKTIKKNFELINHRINTEML
jgi:hypothetical protein